MHHAAGLSCLLYHLHKSITIKWGTALSGCVCASSEAQGDSINISASHLLSLLPLLWLIPLSFHLQSRQCTPVFSVALQSLACFQKVTLEKAIDALTNKHVLQYKASNRELSYSARCIF